MAKTSRRNLLKTTAAAGVSAALGLAIKPETRAFAEESHKHQPISGPLANATISFGHWPTDPPLDRFPNLGAPGKPNGHQLIPNEVKIKAGGTVNFIIGGFHHVLVYDDGTHPGDINPNLLVPGSVPPGLIDDPNNRIYRGLYPGSYGWAEAGGRSLGTTHRDSGNRSVGRQITRRRQFVVGNERTTFACENLELGFLSLRLSAWTATERRTNSSSVIRRAGHPD